MNVKEEKICRLCLGVAENDYQLIDEITKQMLEALLLRVNLDVSKEPIVCKDCTEILIKCFNFKSTCMDREKLRFFTHDKNIPMFESKDVYDNEENTGTADDIFVCRFCWNQTMGRNFDSSRALKKDISFTEKFQALMPELDFNEIKNLVICTSCREDMEYYIRFVENCSNVEDKITKYCQNEGTPSSAQVKLCDILRFESNIILKLDNYQAHVIKKEENTLDGIGEAHLVYDGELIKHEAIDIKDEDDNFDGTDCEIPSDMTLSTRDKSFTATMANYEDCGIKCNMQSNMLFVVDKKKNNSLNIKNVSETILFKCSICPYETKKKCDLKRHTLIHKDVTEVEMYKCSICTFQTKHKCNLKNHLLIHKDDRGDTKVVMYKCSTCTHETKYKDKLKRHMLNHKDVKELVMHKCSMCTYETKHKDTLKKHLLIHKHVTEVEMYKCAICTYETRHKGYLKTHTLTHRDVTEVEMFKCSMCTHETKHKRSLKKHMLIHRDVTEVEMHSCSVCAYQTKQKSNLKKHALIHGDVVEVEIYKCSMCTYETRRKDGLKIHMLIHKDRDKDITKNN